MSRLIETGAVSLLLHGGLVLALLGVPRGGGFVPPRALYIVLPTADGGEARVAGPGAAEGLGQALDARPAKAERRAPRTTATRSEPTGSDPTEAPRKHEVERPIPEPTVSATVPVPAEDRSEPSSTSADASAISTGRTRELPTSGGVATETGSGALSTSGGPGLASLDPGSGAVVPGRATGGGGGASVPGPGHGAETRASPRYSDNPRPAYPWHARVRGEEGAVLLSVLVDTRGRVGDLRVERSSGSRALDDAATEAVRRWVFHPGRRGTQTVESWVQVPIRFRLED